MPNYSHAGIRGDPWIRCNRCGNHYRASHMRWQSGLLLCTVAPGNCYDRHTGRQRDRQIARIVEEATLYPDAQLDSILTNPKPLSQEE